MHLAVFPELGFGAEFHSTRLTTVLLSEECHDKAIETAALVAWVSGLKGLLNRLSDLDSSGYRKRLKDPASLGCPAERASKA
jgi:hypothetical protein